jgi:hypothetical protein
MRALLLIAVLGACGDDGATADAAPDAGPLCDYTEANDVGNATAPEAANLTIGHQTRNLCGTINPGHYDAASNTVDVDRFNVTVDGSADVLVRFFATGVDTSDLSVLIFDSGQSLLNGGHLDTKLGDHGAFRSSLVAGTYDVVVRLRATADVAAAIDYKVRVLADAPCTPITAAAAYTEAHDNADNHGNDVVAVDFSKSTPFTTMPGTAEPTGLTITPAMPVRISGSSADAPGADQFSDRDTYQLATDAMTNELSVLLAWPAGPDLDYVVFQDQSTTETASSTTAGGDGTELATFAVKPSATYWLWVGGRKGTTGLPAAYDLSVCGAQVAN